MPLTLQTPLQVLAEHTSKTKDALAAAFRQNHGTDVLAELLTEAGGEFARGTWIFRVFDTLKTSGRTPPIQVRRPDKGGVILWVKPGSNDSGVKGILLVTRDKNMTPEQAYDTLRKTLAKGEVEAVGHEPPATVNHIPLDLDDTMTACIIGAVLECHGSKKYTGKIDEFVADVSDKLGESGDCMYYLEAMDSLVDRGFLSDNRSYYGVTIKGVDFYGSQGGQKPTSASSPVKLQPIAANGVSSTIPVKPPASNGNGVIHINEAVVPVALELPPAPKPDDVDIDLSDILIRSKDRLQALVELPDKLAKCRKSQASCAEEIAALKEQLLHMEKLLAAAREEEQKLLTAVNKTALMQLLGVA